jgi:hypothetical protein
MNELADRIRTRGYWDVSISPSVFIEDRISLAEFKEILIRSSVRFRGWPVPMVDFGRDFVSGSTWIGQDIDARSVSHEESWRAFQSGQFSMLRVVSADWRTGAEAAYIPPGARSVIEIWEILFFLTEFVEFATRLSLSKAGSKSMTIEVNLVGTADRHLVFGDPSRGSPAESFASMNRTIKAAETIDREVLIGETREVAARMTLELMRSFGFETSIEALLNYQKVLTDV